MARTKTIISIVIAGLFVVSCTNQPEKSTDEKENSEISKQEFYQIKMTEKNFQFEINGPCDDALEDTIHERSVAYFDSKTLTDSNAVIEFKFKDACCQVFLGNYTIENDTLIFRFEQINEEVCSCLCWYRYKLTINEPKQNYASIAIREK